MLFKCPDCNETNYYTRLDHATTIEYDSIRCWSCENINWLDSGNYFAIDESIMVVGKRPVHNMENKIENLVVRKANEEDLNQILKIYKAVIESQNLYKGLNYSSKEIEEKYLSKMYVAEEQEQIYGFFLIFDMGVWALLDVLCVSPDCRKLGVGEKMLSFMDSLAQDKSWRAIETFVEPTNFKTSCYLNKRGYKTYAAMLYLSKFAKDQ